MTLSLENFLSSILFPLTTGAIGWFVVQFLAGPLLELFHLRREIYQHIIFIYNMYPPPHETQDHFHQLQEWLDLCPDIRKLAARLDALKTTVPAWITALIKLLRWDLDQAVRGLIGLSNASRRPERLLSEDDVLKSLKLPRRLTDAGRETQFAILETPPINP